MQYIRKAVCADLPRIAEIEVFNYRLYFYPIFKNDWFYFEEMQVLNRIGFYREVLDELYVYDDGVVKGFVQVGGREVKKLFVEPVLHSCGIGKKLLGYAIEHCDASYLWALEKNTRAIAFYQRNGFVLTEDKRLEEDTTEYLVKLERLTLQ